MVDESRDGITPDPTTPDPTTGGPESPEAERAARISAQVEATDWHVHDEPEPTGDEGEAVAWTADPDKHLSDIEEHLPGLKSEQGALPVCDYTGEGDEPCEEPAVQRRWSSAAIITASAIGAVVGGIFVAVGVIWSLGLLPGSQPIRPIAESTATTVAERPITINTGSNMAEVSEAVAAKVVPSVVNITIRQEGFDPFTGQTFTQDAGNGTGVIIREDGYIVTNNHVVEGADEIVVTVGVTDVPATVVGTDPSSDLAVLKIEGDGFPAIDIGTSADLRVGQYVMAVGSPFGLEKTVTVGIISALNRSSLVDDGQTADLTTYTNLIQTDAAINPGNSGGALVDSNGKLVGINTLIQSTSGSSAGVGFAIPVDFAADIAEQLITTGRATHPYIGVSTETVDENIAAQFGLPVQSGALVRFVQPQSPAEVAGIERGDIIVRIGEREITGVEEVFAAVREQKVGDTLSVEVVRSDTRRTFDVILGSDADRQ